MTNINTMFLEKIFNPTEKKITDNIFINEYVLNCSNPLIRKVCSNEITHDITQEWVLFSHKEQYQSHTTKEEISSSLGTVVNEALITLEKLVTIKTQSPKEFPLSFLENKEVIVPLGYIVITTKDIKDTFNFKFEDEDMKVVVIDIDEYLKTNLYPVADNYSFKNNIFIINAQDYCGSLMINRLSSPLENTLTPVINVERDSFYRQNVEVNLYLKVVIENKENAFCYELKSEQ